MLGLLAGIFVTWEEVLESLLEGLQARLEEVQEDIGER